VGVVDGWLLLVGPSDGFLEGLPDGLDDTDGLLEGINDGRADVDGPTEGCSDGGCEGATLTDG